MATSVEKHHDLVVDGKAAQALDMCQRLLRTGSIPQRVETAHLVLERLRSGSTDDSVDDVNALLRLVGNYVAPTRELTEEILSLLLFCDHRVLLIHHLPKLTYQSKDCVQLVVQAYLELLATDRSLLVPVLGSLAEMPLDNSEKNTVVDATESLLDAAVEEDIPAVVQSLLSMITKASAPKALARLRTECNRIDSGTLSLTMEVIGRYATAGSVALTALLRQIRHVDPLTIFDVIFLTYVMGKSAENELAVKTTTLVAQSGRLINRTMRQATAMLVKPEWASVLPFFVRFCSCLLAACFRASTHSTLALSLIAISVDSLIALIETRSTVQEEALILLLTIVSQPMKLLLFGNVESVQRTRSGLCWNVAEVIALGFLKLAQRNASALASSSHLFLDHLHGIASTAIEVETSGKYPSHILDLLCSTMALLTKNERGIYSLLMITIQKQLVSRSPGLSHDQQASRLQSVWSRAYAVEIKQLMAVFLTGHLLRNQVVIEARDRKSLANWMLRLLTSANRDETLLHVLRFVRDEMKRTRQASSLDQERALLTSAISQVFRKKGLTWTSHGQILQRAQDDSDYVIAFEDDAVNFVDQNAVKSLVLDATDFVVKMRFGVPSPVFGAMSTHEREAMKRLTEQEYLMKICLLRELFYCYLDFAPLAEQTEIGEAAFVLPTCYSLAHNSQTLDSVEPLALNNVIWNLICALDISVASTNFVAEQYSSMVASLKPKDECVVQFSRIVTRLRICLEQRDQLEQMIGAHRRSIQNCLVCLDDTSDSRHGDTQKFELEWLLLEVSIVEQMLDGQLCRVQGELPRASLFGLSFRVICLIFEGQWKRILDPPLSLASELNLLHVFCRHLQSNDVMRSSVYECDALSSTGGNEQLLVSKSEGRQTVLWLCHRATELSRAISSDEFAFDLEGSIADENFEGDSTEAAARDSATRNLMVYSLACIYDSFIVLLEKCRMATAAGDSTWTHKMMELLATGSCPDDDLSCHENPYIMNEIFFRFLARQSLELADPTLACLVMDALVSLVLNTRKSPLISQLCLALLYQTFPLLPSQDQFGSNTGKFFRGLPLRSLPNAVVLPSKGLTCALARYRCPSLKWRHIAYLVVGSWAYSTSASTGSFILAQYLNEMRVLIDASVSKKDQRSHNMRAESLEDSDEESEADDLNEKCRQEELVAVVDGEHLVLKNLTNESSPYFIEAVLLCAIASLYRAAPKKPSTQGLADFNPFSEYCRAIYVVERALRVFAQADTLGYNLPMKTNLIVLRGATFVTRTIKMIIMKCIAWRVEQSVSDTSGALKHLSVLFGAADAMIATMEEVRSAFQERVVLKMQYNGSGRRKGGWTSDLLAKTYGKKYNTRRWITKTEANLLPFFSNGIQELQDLLHDQSTVNNIALELAKANWECAESIRSDFEHRDVMLSDDNLVSACQTLQAKELTTAVLKDWRIAWSIENDDVETDFEDDEEIDEHDEESLSEEENNGFLVKSYASKQSEAESTLSGKNSGGKLHNNEDLGFPTIVVNFKKQKKRSIAEPLTTG